MNTNCGGSGSRFEVTRIGRVELVDAGKIDTRLEPPVQAADRHWQMRVAETPALFNGTVYVMAAAGRALDAADGGTFRGRIHGVNFRTFRYWREVAWDPAFVDVFGSAILISADGDIILGTAGPETINAGRAYFFGGFLDPRDIARDGSADIRESTRRELQEETGLVAGLDVDAAPGHVVAHNDRQASFGVIYRARHGTARVVEQIMHHVRHENGLEVAAVKVIRSGAEADDPSIQPFSAAVIRYLRSAGTS